MWHLLHVIARPLEALLGLFCVLTAIVLYPNEEGKIQSKFEDFWIRVDDFRNLALTRHAAFMTQVARLETRLLDRILGTQLISLQFVLVSACFSLASTFAALLMLSPWMYVDLSPVKGELLRAFVLFFCSPLIVVIAFFLLKNRSARLLLLMLSVTLFATLIIQMTGMFDPSDSDSPIVGLNITAMFVGGFISDIAFIAVMRRLLRFAGQETRTLSVVAVMALAMLLAGCLMSPLFLLLRAATIGQADPGRVLSLGAVVSLADTFDAILALLFVILALLLLVHRAVWPLLTRTLFRMQDIGTKGRRSILTAVGLALLGTSVFGGIPELLKDLIKSFWRVSSSVWL
jgi:hypothetical protein